LALELLAFLTWTPTGEETVKLSAPVVRVTPGEIVPPYAWMLPKGSTALLVPAPLSVTPAGSLLKMREMELWTVPVIESVPVSVTCADAGLTRVRTAMVERTAKTMRWFIWCCSLLRWIVLEFSRWPIAAVELLIGPRASHD